MKLGRANIDALGRSLTAKQFMEWETYAGMEPFSELRADYRTASIVQMIANVNRGKDQKAYKLHDFLLRFEETEPKRKQTWQEQRNILTLMAKAFNSLGI